MFAPSVGNSISSIDSWSHLQSPVKHHDITRDIANGMSKVAWLRSTPTFSLLTAEQRSLSPLRRLPLRMSGNPWERQCNQHESYDPTYPYTPTSSALAQQPGTLQAQAQQQTLPAYCQAYQAQNTLIAPMSHPLYSYQPTYGDASSHTYIHPAAPHLTYQVPGMYLQPDYVSSPPPAPIPLPSQQAPPSQQQQAVSPQPPPHQQLDHSAASAQQQYSTDEAAAAGPSEPIKELRCWDHGCNGRAFSTHSNLLRHQREKSGKSLKYTCPNCNAQFTRNTAMKAHMEDNKCGKKRGSAASHRRSP